jgi:hypothetical protein
VQGAAALALWPPNADRHVALNALVDQLAAEGSIATGGAPIDVRRWRQWLASRSSKQLRRVQPHGIHDAPLSVQGVLLGSRRGLLAGNLESPDVHYRLWTEAISGLLEEGPDPALRTALDLLDNASRLSDRVVASAELGGYRWPDHRLGGELSLPDEAEYGRLCEAVTVPAQELEVAGGLDRTVLTELILSGETPGRWQPLASGVDGELLVANPWRLLLAALVRACAHAARSPRSPALVERLSSAALDLAVEAAQDMDWEIERVRDASLLARADTNTHVLVVVHTLLPAPEADQKQQPDAPVSLTVAYERTRRDARRLGVQHVLLALLGDGRGLAVPRSHPCMNAVDATDPWLLALADLQLVADALRRDPLALPSALEHAPRPPWPESIDLVDFVGVCRHNEEAVPDQADLPQDGTEHLRLRARVMAARHPAPLPDGSGWSEVSRWSGSPDKALFCARDMEGFSLLVRATGRSLWVVGGDGSASRYDLSGVVCTMLAHWLARLCEQGWPHRPTPLSAMEMVMRIEVEVSKQLGPALAIGDADGQLRVIAGPGFVEDLCRGDNSADRMLIAAVLAWCGDRSDKDQRDLLNKTAPEGRGTFVIWPRSDVPTNPPRLLPPPLVAPRDRRAVEQELAGTLVGTDQIVTISDERIRPALRDLVTALECRIAERVATLASSCLVDLVALHERALLQSTVESVALPARDAVADANEHLGPREAVGARNLALRALIERISAAPPDGCLSLGTREAGWLRAAAEFEFILGSAYGALSTGHSGARIVVGPGVGVAVHLEGRLQTAGERMTEQLEQSAPDLMAREHAAWWTEAPQVPPPLRLDAPIELDDADWVDVDRAMHDEWQVGFEQLLRLLRALSDMADEQDDAMAISAPGPLLDSLCTATRIDQTTTARAIELLTLERCENYDVTAKAHRPWGPNRDRSYLRQPLVRLPDGRLAWSSLHTLTCSRYLHGLVESGRLRGGPALRKAVQRFSQRLDREYETVLLERVEGLGWQALPRVRRLGGKRLERRRGQSIGDVDVLAWSRDRRQVWLLDAKRLAPGLDAPSMVRESAALSDQVAHHRERLEWVREHPDRLAAEIHEPGAIQWNLRAALVVDRPLAGAHLKDLALPVWTFWELPRRLEDT